MNIPVRTLVCVLALLAFSACQPEKSLKVGDPAPQLKPAKWVWGDPVAQFEPGKVYVVEFWGTWCPACVQTIPHLNQLQDEFKDRDVIIIGQSVAEREEDALERFVARMGSKITYRIAADDFGQQDTTAMAWLRAAGIRSVPTAFVIDKQGRIAWIGHAGALEAKDLEAILLQRD